MHRSTSRVFARASLFFLALAAVGCVQERPVINRVQPSAISKSFFVGSLTDAADDPEFYMRATVVDAAAGAGNDGLFTSSDAQPTSRVRFEITERLLLARLTYERVDDTDYKGVRRVPDGQVVAAYAIEKHFDVRREYNPTTGEQLNIIVENDADRPWFQREHMRVDWSRNMVTTAYELDTLSMLNIYYNVRWEPVAYYVSDLKHPDAPVFDTTRGYFDITNKAFATPEVIQDPSGETFPACWLVGRFPFDNCNPSEITLRLSFLKVEDKDYEPMNWDGVRMETFGLFTVDRFGYDRRHGVVDERWNRFATRWNLYEKSHVSPPVLCNTRETTPVGKSPNRDEDGDGTEDECASVGRGSRCDAFRGECTLPMRERKVRTIPWYVNPGYPESLFEAARRSLDAWSESIRVAVVAGRVAECRRTGGSTCESDMQWPNRWADDYTPPVGQSSPAEVPRVFVMCHNPVDAAKDDLTACGPAGTSPRLGDLRYNFVNLIDAPEQMRPWGIMSDAEDPLTGEKISGSVNQWAATLDRAAGTLVDILSLLNGQSDPTRFIAGRDVTDWVRAQQRAGDASRARVMGADELTSRLQAFDPSVLSRFYDNSPATGRRQLPPRARRKQRLQSLLDQGRLGPGNAALAERLSRLRRTPIEADLVTPDLLQAAGLDPTALPSSGAIDRASPFGWMNPAQRRARQRNARLIRAKRHACRIDGAEPDNLIGLAKVARTLFPPPDPNDPTAVADHQRRVYDWAREQFAMGVFAHEFGHSVGLRHNFAASFDSLNYAPQYWQLRTRNGTVTADCPANTVDGSNCVGPRWRDPISQDELDGNIGRYATTSVMDYPGDANQDQVLLGKYDRAAMRFTYGGVVDVWNDDGVRVGGSGSARAKAYKLSVFTSNPGLFGIFDFPTPNPDEPYQHIHYSQYQKEFGLLRDCQDASGPDVVLGKKCSEAPMDVVDWRDMSDFAADPAYASFVWAVNRSAVDRQGRVRRGYMFSSDEYADTGNVPAFAYDAGADAYEQIRFLESQYENRYLLDGFRRGRVQFNTWDSTARMQGHYLDAIQMIAKTFAFGAVLDGDPTAPTTALLADGNYGPLALGATVAMDLFARILVRPEPGYYCKASDCSFSGQPAGVASDVFVADTVAQPEEFLYDFRVPFGDGRYLHNDYDYSQGYWWSDYQSQVGTYYEKVWAVYYLAEAFDYFISSSKDDFTDSRYKNVSFATVFPAQVRRLFSNLMTGDLEAYAPWVVVPANPDDTPTAELVYPRWHGLTPSARPASSLIVDPNYGWNVQLYAMVWGTMFFPTNWSQSFVDEARITLLAADQTGWPASETYTFKDPETGMTYRAHTVGKEQGVSGRVEKGIGARALEWANALLVSAYLVERDAQNRPRLAADGTPIVLRGADERPRRNPDGGGSYAALRKHVDAINILRQLTSTFGRSLAPGDLPQP